MRPALEVADVFRRHGEAFRRSHGAHLGRVERRVMAAIETCRTPTLGGHVEQCGDCGLIRCAYNSCLWGIHLTGVGGLPPRAAQRRSLQAGRMSASSRWFGRSGLSALAHNKILVTNRSMRDSKLQDPVE